MMKVALIGASGQAGSRILRELSNRGHAVTAIARNPKRIEVLAGVTPVRGDVADADALASILSGHDAVVSSVHFLAFDAETLIAAVRASGVKRYLVVGGAGSLEVAPGQRLLDAPGFPDAYKAEASAGANYLDRLRAEDDLDWTFFSPAAMFVPGERTGRFRLGEDALIANDQGSSISFEDYAIALVDELEQPRHVRGRFTIGY
ncbi:NAD(P)-dependent oxidoreductase [Aureimonas sp. AU4]|uniref:NAD(P)-dependent oxidoreductase n=1 Tax=Aureimonas sp. AU4 TaxID=1638163 RepID=UPI000780FE67|nr:NAD(P)-dependent oxidoreductase [Aureimonas sp. AU4]